MTQGFYNHHKEHVENATKKKREIFENLKTRIEKNKEDVEEIVVEEIVKEKVYFGCDTGHIQLSEELTNLAKEAGSYYNSSSGWTSGVSFDKQYASNQNDLEKIVGKLAGKWQIRLKDAKEGEEDLHNVTDVEREQLAKEGKIESEWLEFCEMDENQKEKLLSFFAAKKEEKLAKEKAREEAEKIVYKKTLRKFQNGKWQNLEIELNKKEYEAMLKAKETHSLQILGKKFVDYDDEQEGSEMGVGYRYLLIDENGIKTQADNPNY